MSYDGSSSSWSIELVCSVWLWYFLIILTKYYEWFDPMSNVKYIYHTDHDFTSFHSLQQVSAVVDNWVEVGMPWYQ